MNAVKKKGWVDGGLPQFYMPGTCTYFINIMNNPLLQTAPLKDNSFCLYHKNSVFLLIAPEHEMHPHIKADFFPNPLDFFLFHIYTG